MRPSKSDKGIGHCFLQDAPSDDVFGADTFWGGMALPVGQEPACSVELYFSLLYFLPPTSLWVLVTSHFSPFSNVPWYLSPLAIKPTEDYFLLDRQLILQVGFMHNFQSLADGICVAIQPSFLHGQPVSQPSSHRMTVSFWLGGSPHTKTPGNERANACSFPWWSGDLWSVRRRRGFNKQLLIRTIKG